MAEYIKKGHLIEHDADWWRMMTQKAFLSDPGAPGSLALFGSEPAEHTEYARHIVAEYLREYLKGEYTEAYVWAHVPGSIWDWLDATVGAWVGCCMLGADFDTPVNVGAKKTKPPRRRAKAGKR